MPLVNNIKPILDQPVWEWARFAPATTTSLSSLVSDGNRYMYYLVGSAFYRYDTITDNYIQLASPTVAPITTLSISYAKYGGNRGRVLAQISSNKIKLPYIVGNALKNTKINIISGSGAGQVRTITSSDTELVESSGLVTSATALTLTDSTQKWKPNQWVGYNCRITYSTGVQLQRTILYNTVDTLWFQDTNYEQYEPFDNVSFSTAPVSTAGSQSHFIITSQTVTLDNNLTVNVDDSSRFLVETGNIWLVSSSASAPFITLQVYDIANDIWLTKTVNANLFTAALATDCNIEHIEGTNTAFLTGNCSSATARTLVDSTKDLIADRYVNYQIRITGGTGAGQKRRVVANGTNYFEVAKKWDITPDNTSTYVIFGDTDSMYLSGNNASTLFKYSVENNLWSQSNIVDSGVAANITAQKNGTLPFGIASGIRNTGAITSVAINNGGSGYRVGDVLTVSGGGGTNGKVYVETINSTGVIQSVSLMRCGATYSITTGAATTGGTGTLATVNIISIGIVSLYTTTTAHPFKIGDSITIKGASEAAYNTNYIIIGVDGTAATIPTTFETVVTATSNIAALNSSTTTVLVDASANWDINELTGKTLYVYVAGNTGAATVRRILSNTATTITVNSTVTITTGTSRYLVTEPEALGRDNQFQKVNQFGYGIASAGSTTTTLVDSSKDWTPGCWTGYRVRIIAGTGLGNEIAITGNTSNTLTWATQSFTPDITTRYRIMDTFGIATSGSTTTLVDTTKNWKVNQWAGKRVRITGGTGLGIEFAVTSNTSTTLTFTAISATVDNTTQYTILGIPNRSTGMSLIWTYGGGNDKYIYSFRGGSFPSIDRYDITTDTWEYGLFTSPQFESFTTGSMYAYNKTNRIYVNHNATNRILYFDLVDCIFVNSGTIPYGHSTAILGNRMEIVETPDDNLQFLYVMRHTGVEMFRTLLFF